MSLIDEPQQMVMIIDEVSTLEVMAVATAVIAALIPLVIFLIRRRDERKRKDEKR